MSPAPSPSSTALCSRRALLAGGLGLGTGAVLVTLTGCGSDELADGGTERVPVDQVPVGGGAIVGWYVVTQPTDGEFQAFHAACPHQNVKVTGVAEGRIACDLHAAYFTLEGGRGHRGSDGHRSDARALRGGGPGDRRVHAERLTPRVRARPAPGCRRA